MFGRNFVSYILRFERNVNALYDIVAHEWPRSGQVKVTRETSGPTFHITNHLSMQHLNRFFIIMASASKWFFQEPLKTNYRGQNCWSWFNVCVSGEVTSYTDTCTSYCIHILWEVSCSVFSGPPWYKKVFRDVCTFFLSKYQISAST